MKTKYVVIMLLGIVLFSLVQILDSFPKYIYSNSTNMIIGLTMRLISKGRLLLPQCSILAYHSQNKPIALTDIATRQIRKPFLYK